MAKDDRKRKRRRGGLIDILNGFLTLIVLGLIVAVGGFVWGATQFYAAGPEQAEATFFVEKGNGLGTIAQRLDEQGLIENAWLFRAGAWTASRNNSTILPGEYLIPAKSSMADILDIITSGKPAEYFVMVNPGQSSYEVAALLNDPAENLTGDPVAPPPEGTVLPIRHDYFPRDDRATLLKAMQDEMTAVVDRLWSECRPDVCGPQGVLENKEEFVILASIVEKETGLAEERPEVAALFVNRLRKGMRLETDPTILYGLYQGVPQEKLTITESQKNRETAYNTYFIDGLPPTPIANPGVAALQAVANPATNDYLYMMAKVPGDYTKGHYFATTYDEHQDNVRKYRVQEREQAAEEPEDAGASQ